MASLVVVGLCEDVVLFTRCLLKSGEYLKSLFFSVVKRFIKAGHETLFS